MSDPEPTPVCTPWPVIYPCAPCLADHPDPALLAQMTAVAETILGGLTQRRFGLCHVTYRPCRSDHLNSVPRYSFESPYGWRVPTFTWGCGAHVNRACSCTTSSSLVLPALTSSVEAVWQDGVELDPSLWRFDGRRLWRTDGLLWPSCQDLAAGDHEDGALAVEALAGVPVPLSGQYALGALACELAVAGKPECRLPQRVQSITRQGVTMTILDPQAFLDEGKTGLYLVDLFITTENPTHQSMPSQVWSPDLA